MRLLLIILCLFAKCQAQVVVFGMLRDTSHHGVTGIDFVGKTAVWTGDSYVHGVAASSTALRFSSLFCSGRGATESNFGVDGATMETNVCGFPTFDPNVIPTYNSSIHSSLFISVGTNDVGFNNASFTPAGLKTFYTTAVTTAITTKGWPPELIIIFNTYKPFSFSTYVGGCSVVTPADAARSAEFNVKIAEVASENGVWLVDIYTQMSSLNSTFFAGDGLHPNDAGHAFIANYLINYLGVNWMVFLIPGMILRRKSIEKEVEMYIKNKAA